MQRKGTQHRPQKGRENKNRVRYVQVALKGWVSDPPVPDGVTMGLVCLEEEKEEEGSEEEEEEGEENDTKRTHIGLVWREAQMTMKQVKDLYRAKCGGEPQVTVHRTHRTIFGDHMGRERQPLPCKQLRFWGTSRKEIEADLYAGDKKRKGTVREKNTRFLNTPLKALVQTGELHIMNYKKAKQNVEEYQKDTGVGESRLLLGASFPMVWNRTEKVEYPVDLQEKRCHYWFYSEMPDVGKTWSVEQLIKTHRAIMAPYNSDWKEMTDYTDIIVLDEYAREQCYSIPLLNQLCDGTATLNVKFSSYSMKRKRLIIVCANASIEAIYPQFHQFVKARFNEIKINAL